MGQCQPDAGDGDTRGQNLAGVRGGHVMEEDADVHPDGNVCSGDHRQTNNHSVSASLQSGEERAEFISDLILKTDDTGASP